MEKKVTIIVPVYNSAKYLKKCIDSLLQQSYFNLEIIIVNDGSTDESEAIILDRQRNDARIKYIRQQNQGVSHARNQGLNRAVGEYVIFVDSDDHVHQDYVKELVRTIENHELGVCGYCRVNKNGEAEFCGVYKENPLMEMKGRDFIDFLFGSEIYQGYLWNKIFRLQILQDNKLRFDEKIFFNEDRLFVFQYALQCNTVCCLNQQLYYYLNNDSGAVEQAKQKVTEKSFSEFDAYYKMIDELKTRNMEEPLSKAAIDMCYSAKQLVKICIDKKSRDKAKKIWNDSVKIVMKSNADSKDKLKILLKRFIYR